MATYTINLPDDVVLTAVHRFAPSNESAPPRWSVSVQPHPDGEAAFFTSGNGVHPDLQHAANEAVALLRKNLRDLEPWILRQRAAREASLKLTSTLELDL